MAEKSIFIPRLWRRMAAAARIVLALGLVARLGIEYGWEGHRTGLWMAVAYLAFSIGYAAIETWHRGTGRAIGFCVDAAAFAAAATLIPSAWQSQLQYAYLLITVLLFHDWLWLAAAFAAVAVAPGRLFSAMGALMLLASLAMLLRQVLQDRLFQSSRQAVLHRAEAIHARDAERGRLANDFHDGPLQVFTGLQVRLSVLKRMIEKNKYEEAIAEINALQELWQSQVLQVRAFVNQVRSGEAKPVDVEAAVTRLADEFQKQTGIVVELKIEAMREGSGEALLGLVLMVGEALQNIHKHAGATKTRVTIGFADGAVTAAVDDDGTGFPFGGTYTLDDLELMGIGPVSIRRRVRELGGELSVESRPGRGSTLRIRVPA